MSTSRPAALSTDLANSLRAFIPTLPGWGSPEKCVRLANLVLEAGATWYDPVSVELGVFGGRTLVGLATGHDVLRRGCVFGIDPYDVAADLEGTNAPENDAWWSKIDHESIYQGCVKMLKETIEDPLRWTLLRLKSLDAVDLFRNVQVHILHQDSNHSEEVSWAEINHWWPTLAHGGYWIMDDVDWPTTQKAQRLLLDLGAQVFEDYPRMDTQGAWRIYQKC